MWAHRRFCVHWLWITLCFLYRNASLQSSLELKSILCSSLGTFQSEGENAARQNAPRRKRHVLAGGVFSLAHIPTSKQNLMLLQNNWKTWVNLPRNVKNSSQYHLRLNFIKAATSLLFCHFHLLLDFIFNSLPSSEIFLTLLEQSFRFGNKSVQQRVAWNANSVQESELERLHK